MTNLKKESINLCEVLVKTSFSTQITDPSDKNCENPIGFGSGFMVEYKDNVFFVTADHVVHPEDHKYDIRTGNDYVVSVFNNIVPKDNFLSTIITPLGGFYYMESFNLLKPNDAPELVDVSVCILNQKHFQYQFLTTEVRFQDLTIKAGEQKLRIPSTCFADPNDKQRYCVFGRIRSEIIDIKLHWVDTLKEGLKFIKKSGDYFLFHYPEIITDYEDWAGLSGSPVLSDTGDCVGVICSVLEKSKSLWVMPIQKVTLLMDVAINQELMNVAKAK